MFVYFIIILSRSQQFPTSSSQNQVELGDWASSHFMHCYDVYFVYGSLQGAVFFWALNLYFLQHTNMYWNSIFIRRLILNATISVFGAYNGEKSSMTTTCSYNLDVLRNNISE